MENKIYDNFIVTYDECGKALAYVSHDDACIWWDVSLPTECREKYKNKLDEMEDTLFDLRELQSYPFTDYHAAFVQMARDLLEIIKLTCDDWERNRVPDFFLNRHGGIDFERVKKLKAINDFSPELNVPYYDPKEHSLFYVAAELFSLASDDIMSKEEGIEMLELTQNDFETQLTTMELKFRWFDHRHLCSQFYCFVDDNYDLYMASDVSNSPIFMFFKENQNLRSINSEATNNELDNDSEQKAA